MPTDNTLSPDQLASFLRKSVGETKEVKIVSRYGNHVLPVSEAYLGLDGILYLSVLAQPDATD